MKACLMTLSEYQATVTPLFKAFNKFMKKNGQYFKKKNYSGLICLTYPQFIEKELEHLKKQYKNLAEDDSYARQRWFDSVNFREKPRTDEEVPADILKMYHALIKQFEQYFSKEEITSRIERDELNSNKRAVRRAIEKDFYVDALKDGEVTPARLVEIFDSLELKMPKRILELKTKVETQGYDRSTELAQVKKTKEFEDELRKELGPYYEELRQRELRRIEIIVDEFEKSSSDLYNYLRKFDRIPSYKNQLESLLNELFKGDYVKEENRRVYKYMRREDYNDRLQLKATAFAEDFIRNFVHRIELKLRVITAKLGAPVFKITKANLHAEEFECLVTVTWPNKVSIVIEAEVIIAGGYNIQVTHYRYLLKTFYNGKYIDLENIDALNFV